MRYYIFFIFLFMCQIKNIDAMESASKNRTVFLSGEGEIARAVSPNQVVEKKISRSPSPKSPLGKVLQVMAIDDKEPHEHFSAIEKLKDQTKKIAFTSLMNAIRVHDNMTVEQLIRGHADQSELISAQELVLPQGHQNVSPLLFAFSCADKQDYCSHICAYYICLAVGAKASNEHILMSNLQQELRSHYLRLVAYYQTVTSISSIREKFQSLKVIF